MLHIWKTYGETVSDRFLNLLCRIPNATFGRDLPMQFLEKLKDTLLTVRK